MFVSPKLSLKQLLGSAYCGSVARAAVALTGLDPERATALVDEAVDFYPAEMQEKGAALLEKIGQQIVPPFENQMQGAPTASFRKAAHNASAPIGGYGCTRLGEDGRLYLIGKSEHYHASLGHGFPGYRLIRIAQELGIDNVTHNNTRGYITRLCEREIIRDVNGLAQGEEEALDALIASREPKVLNRIINLETGSLAVEAGIKMMLARFYRLDPSFPQPPYAGKTPVFLVMSDFSGGKTANYHGTTVLTQTTRGMWPDFYRQAEEAGLYKVVQVSINDETDFKAKLAQYNQGGYKTAGFLHEIVLMNYGGVRLTPEYLGACYAACAQADTPTLVDEIQSCMWYKGEFLFRLYGLNPDFAVIGKGFPGGQFPASKIITTAQMDSLNQFGALVTNGQEELASLAYLITMTFARANGDVIESLGNSFEEGMRALAKRHANLVARVEGKGHLAALHFPTLGQAADFAGMLNQRSIDLSAQTYKAECPPAVLLKPPLTACAQTLSYIVEACDKALSQTQP